MSPSERELIDRLTAISGLHPKVVDFIVFCGFRIVVDQSLEEQIRSVGVKYGLSRSESLDLIADEFRDSVAEFYVETFPVVRRNK